MWTIALERIAHYFPYLAFLFTVSAYWFYCQNIWRSTTRPTVSTWVSWYMVDAALLAAMISAAFSGPSFQPEKISFAIAAYTAGTTVVLVVSAMKHAGWGDWGRKDTFAVGSVVLALVAWYFTNNVNVAVIITLAACTIGTWPMLTNLWKDPKLEAFSPWICVTIGTAFDLADVAATGEWTIQRAASPLVFLSTQVLILALMARRFILRPIPT